MARPQKNNVDYFPHDRDMRDHKKVKAIRLKFGISGYAVWSMLLEYLAGNDGNVFEYSDIEFELMAGDFGVSATEIRDIVDYCIRLEMLFIKDGFVNSESLDERLFPVYQKRGKSKELSKKQQRVNGKFSGINTDSTEVSASEIPQSKVKESKVKDIKLNESKEDEPSSPPIFSFLNSLISLGVEDQTAKDWMKVRKERKATNTETALKAFLTSVEKSGKTVNEVVKICAENSWKGFNKDWLTNSQPNPKNNVPTFDTNR